MAQAIAGFMNSNPRSAIEKLLDGYRRFKSGDWPAQRDLWADLETGQSPKTMVISCSDSRVDPSQILGTAPGDIFVVRNVAALVPPFETTSGQHGVSAALEFAVQVLKIEEIVVMGHGLCGGCQAALTQKLKNAEIGSGAFVQQWIGLLDEARVPVAEKHGTSSREAELAMELAAVKVSLANLRSFPFVEEKLANGSLGLHGMHFAISDGILRMLDSDGSEFRNVE